MTNSKEEAQQERERQSNYMLTAGPAPARKTIDLEGRIVKDAVRKSLQQRQGALGDLIHAIREYRKLSEQPIAIRGSDYAHAVLELNKAVDRADILLKT